MRILALLAAYNEQRFIANCLDHLIRQGVDVYVIDNSSTDATVAIAERYLGRGLVGIETMSRTELFEFERILRRKEALAACFDADWFIHLDTDEIRLAPNSRQTLNEAIHEVDEAGYNAVDFLEFTFVPTIEAPDHDHDNYLETMAWYYPFRPFDRHRLNAWKRQPGGVDLVTFAGHAVGFPGLKAAPRAFPMRHYLCLSVPHAIRKYASRRHPPSALAAGWHRWREQLDPTRIILPSQSELRRYLVDEALDPSDPWTWHALIARKPTAAGAGRPAGT